MKRAWLRAAAGLFLVSCAVSPPPAPDAFAAAEAAVARAAADTRTARALGLDQSAWDLVRIAHEDIAAAETSIDSGEYAEAERLAAGASNRLRGAIEEAVAARMGEVKAAVAEACRSGVPEERIAAAEQDVAAAAAAAAARDSAKAKSLLDRAAASLAQAPSPARPGTAPGPRD
jgi:hypothetical protein